MFVQASLAAARSTATARLACTNIPIQASLAAARATARLACTNIQMQARLAAARATARLACKSIPVRDTVCEMMLLMMDW